MIRQEKRACRPPGYGRKETVRIVGGVGRGAGEGAMGTKILVIDDDEAVLEFLRLKLGREFAVSTLTDARKAVTTATAQRPDVVLCDIDMPHMNGAEVAAAFAKNPALAKIPLIFLTNVLSPSEVAGMGGVVSGHRSIAKRAPIGEIIAGIKAALAR